MRFAIKSERLKMATHPTKTECYADAVEQASAETELSIETFPQLSVYTSTEVLDSNFLPDEIISK